MNLLSDSLLESPVALLMNLDDIIHEPSVDEVPASGTFPFHPDGHDVVLLVDLATLRIGHLEVDGPLLPVEVAHQEHVEGLDFLQGAQLHVLVARLVLRDRKVAVGSVTIDFLILVYL